MAGFTTIQSPGQPGDVDLREAIARGVLPGPRILTSIAQITPGSGTPDELRQKVRELKKQRADVVKIIDSVGRRGGMEQTMTRDQFEALCGEAKAQGLSSETDPRLGIVLQSGAGRPLYGESERVKRQPARFVRGECHGSHRAHNLA